MTRLFVINIIYTYIYKYISFMPMADQKDLKYYGWEFVCFLMRRANHKNDTGTVVVQKKKEFRGVVGYGIRYPELVNMKKRGRG